MTLTERELFVLHTAFKTRIKHLRGVLDQCVGTLYPPIIADEIDDLMELFEKLTGTSFGQFDDN